MLIEMESTGEVVVIQGCPCRVWNIKRLNGIEPQSESVVFTRMLVVDPKMDLADDHVVLLDGWKPPTAEEFPEAKQIN
jgi:hypothetical protein